MDPASISGEQSVQLRHSATLRGPLQMAIDLTNKCNFRCLHCFNMSGETWIVDEELTDEEVLKTLEDVRANLKPFNFCFCGGEPFLRFDLLRRALNLLSTSCPDLSLVTNGSLVTEEKAKELVRVGLTRVQVSLDGATAGTHERLRGFRGAFKRALAAIESFKKAGVREIQVAFCPVSFNISEFAQAYDLCGQLGIAGLRVQPLMPLGRGAVNSESITPTPWQYRELIREIDCLRKTRERPTLEWGDPIDHLIRFSTAMTLCYPYMAIKANGAIEVSPYIPLSVGNVRRHTPTEYWEAGFPSVWHLPLVQELARRIQSIPDMNRTGGDVPVVWSQRDLEFDLVDRDYKPAALLFAEVAARGNGQ